MKPALSSAALDQLFFSARTHNVWLAEPVEDELLERLWALMRMAPTSANCSPLRIVFVKSAPAKERLKPALMAGNIDKTMSAPVTAILAYDVRFYEHLSFLFPHTDARAWFDGPGKEDFARASAVLNASLQVAYFILAARALGLDCGPMTGFDNAMVDAAFFPEGRHRSHVLCNLGVGDDSKLFPRSPRFEFAQACRIV